MYKDFLGMSRLITQRAVLMQCALVRTHYVMNGSCRPSYLALAVEPTYLASFDVMLMMLLTNLIVNK